MSDTKWAQGPLMYAEVVGYIQSTDGQVLLDVDSLPIDDEEDRDALGYLFAAAPELRDALEKLRSEVERLTLPSHFGHEGSALLELMSDARAALAKARGEAA